MPLPWWHFPVRRDISQHEPDELHRRFVRREVPARAHAAAHGAVQRLDRVRRVDDFPDHLRERIEGDHLLPVPPPGLGDRRVSLAPGTGVKFLEPLSGNLGILGPINRLLGRSTS
jgi:hypothetical protein